ncbi:MAG TPA: endonuclease/exonuclease/phosphatase family protein [Phycisphaerae bacterium]|jgi:endonuclease/exonuclease/phosphatase family metal-dependent hydrolase|nr:endonuclease/exonuclease/phosphatase family protein [Phycisphaerae bacterium]HOB73062.1 endonuclease/exonuclease/phosphatase family protein [Phycisphaerae bacterium]HOJ54057.1 endonuclease/exonuclease/phosphatase family protein [Phycisphaerae bacterium]HOL26468.1 endonuclease/exonuclease/phosphatase family protein [Phycisphaerae bacterium]HPP20447.1 endonuclease/exonuclease/phosphatase family protein [Phycisphaerae bacterium]
MLLNLLTTGLILSGGFLSQPATSPADDARNVRVMSFNVRYGTAGDGENRWELRRELLFDVIRRHAPDVLGLQEPLRFQLDEIRAAVPGYAELGAARDDGKEKGEYSAILYRSDRLQPVESGTFWLSDTPEIPGSKTWGNKLPRVCTWARFEDRVTGREFYAYNTHLDHQSQPARERGVELIARRIAERKVPTAPVVVTGDFNAAESNPAIRYLLEGPGFRARRSDRGERNRGQGERRAANLRDGPLDAAGEGQDAGVALATRPAPSERTRLVDTFRLLHPDAENYGTFNGFKGVKTGEKIDYILVLPGTKVLRAEILYDNRDGRYPSDHFPLLAVLRFVP